MRTPPAPFHLQRGLHGVLHHGLELHSLPSARRHRRITLASLMPSDNRPRVDRDRASGPRRPLRERRSDRRGGLWDYLTSTARRNDSTAATPPRPWSSTLEDLLVGEIADVGIHGVIAVPPNRIFTSNGRGDNASIVDAKTLQLISKVETQESRLHHVRAEAARGLHDERPRPVGDGHRCGDRQGGRDDPARRQPEARSPTSPRAASTSTSRTEQHRGDRPGEARVVANWPIAPGEKPPAWRRPQITASSSAPGTC